MAGIEPLPSLSDAQVSSMAGGPILCVQAVAADTRGANMDPGDVKLNATSRLGKALLESKLGLPLLIQVAQQRQSCVYKTSDTHLKSLASLFDTVWVFPCILQSAGSHMLIDARRSIAIS